MQRGFAVLVPVQIRLTALIASPPATVLVCTWFPGFQAERFCLPEIPYQRSTNTAPSLDQYDPEHRSLRRG
jgi:hypothetical protein